jgi:predicted phosphoribosyltransferase
MGNKTKTQRIDSRRPVATRESVDKLSQVVDRIIVIHCCSSYDNDGEHYTDFIEVCDDEIERIMKK